MNSLKKMEWVDKNVKPVYVLIDTSIARRALREMQTPAHELTTVSGSSDDFQKFLQDVLNEANLTRNSS